ncbi:MAG: FlgD immunoglobulin-like domain containing protein, partial [Candidatus Krumholzibacteria bacterium]|nr:FlgD immunoglobulin-like domain containing protein [Candidatus Krumholzibacteria bacterium]
VFDARGRLVRELASGRWAAGEHHVHWDGRAADGQPAAAGIYMLRLEAECGVQNVKAALVK